MPGQLAGLDFVVLAAYLGGTLLLGLYLGRGIHTGKDYFLAGRNLPWWVIGMSLVASDIGGTDIIGVGGAAYSYGMAVGNFEWIGCIPAMLIGAFVFIPFFWRSGVYTIPEFMERRYNAAVRAALAFCWLGFMACNLGIMLFASAKMMNGMLGLEFLPADYQTLAYILLTAALVGVYTYAGGLAAVVYTDTIQCVVMIGGCLLVVVMGINEFGGLGPLRDAVRENEAQVRQAQIAELEAADPIDERELQHLKNADPDHIEHTELILPVDTRSPFPWPGILIGLAMVLSPAYWFGNQAIVQRSLGAKSEFQAKASYVSGALLKNLIPIIIAVPGVIAFAKFPELKDADTAFPTLVAHLLPSGLRGLFLAAFLAALMSSVDSYLNSAATIITNDFYMRFYKPDISDEHVLSVGRVATIVLLIWAIGFATAVSFMEGSGIYTIFQTLMAFFQGPALAILLCGVLWRRATGIGAFVGFVTGVAFSVTLFTLNQQAVYTALGIEPLFQIADPFLYFSVWAFLVSLTVIIIVSLCTKPEPDEKIAGLVYQRHLRTAEKKD